MKGGRLVQSVPGELNMDHTAVLQKAEVYIIIHRMGAWSMARVLRQRIEYYI